MEQKEKTVQSWLYSANHYASIGDWRNENLCREYADSLAELEAMDIADSKKKPKKTTNKNEGTKK